MFVLTSEYNDYDQHGEYFEALFKEKPTPEQLIAHGVAQYQVDHVLGGGGRQGTEDVWFNLNENLGE